MKRMFFYILILLFAFLQNDTRPVSANNQKRIRFQMTTISEKDNEQKILAQASVEGLSGTDFNINLQTQNFKMQSGFVTDLISSDKLKIRANLNTRRFYGVSPINLPLYEEDSQKQVFEVGFDETMVLLPFGRNGGDETLKIEITPILLTVSKEEAEKPISIKFDKQIPGGEIHIGASKIPHHYEVEAILLSNGKEIAKAKSNFLYQEEKEIILQTTDNQTFIAKVRINEFKGNRPRDLVGIDYKFSRQNSSVIEQGAGVSMLGEEFGYLLENEKNLELRFKINLSAQAK